MQINREKNGEKGDFFAEKRVLLRKCFTFICVYQNFFVPLQPQKS